MRKKRYTLCGLSMRALCQYALPLLGQSQTENCNHRAELVGILDIDRARVQDFLKKVGATAPYYPLFGGKELIDIPPVAGGHGGADLVIRRDLLDGPCAGSRELRLVAGSEEGALAVAVGEAVWRSAREKRPISIAKLLDGSL